VAATVHADALQTWTHPLDGRRRLHVFCSKNLPFASSKPLTFLPAKNACASLPTTTLDVLLPEDVRALLPGNSPASRAGDIATHLLSKTHYASLTDLHRIPGPPRLTYPRPARAACDNVGNNRVSSSKVTSPIFAAPLAPSWNHHVERRIDPRRGLQPLRKFPMTASVFSRHQRRRLHCKTERRSRLAAGGRRRTPRLQRKRVCRLTSVAADGGCAPPPPKRFHSRAVTPASGCRVGLRNSPRWRRELGRPATTFAVVMGSRFGQSP